MKLAALLTCLTLVPLTQATAQTERVARETTIQRRTQPGIPVRIRTYTAFSRQCEPRPAPSIVIRDPAAHGTVGTRPGVATVTIITEGAPDCSGHTLPGIDLIYTPQPGFVGTDRVTYDVVFITGQPRHDTALIDIR